MKKPLVQTFPLATVTTGKTPDGTILAKITFNSGRVSVVPLDIVMLAAGKDAWMREITFKCPDCGNRKKASEFATSNMCNDCEEKFFSCDKCGRQHHPDDGCREEDVQAMKAERENIRQEQINREQNHKELA